MSLTTDSMSAADLAAVVGNDRNNGGLFGGEGLGAVLTIIIIIALLGGGWGGLGFGGWGGMGGAMMGAGMMGGFDGFGLYPWLNNSQHISDGFRDQMLQSSVQGIQSAVTSGFGDVQLGIAGINQNICQTGAGIVNGMNQGFAGVNQTINGAQSAISTHLYNNEIANLNRSFAEQTANVQGFNGVQAQLAQCCCDQKAGIADVKYTIATEECATRNSDTQNTQAVLNAINGGIQSIKDQLCNDKIDAKNDEIAQLRQEVLFARGQASQVTQNGQIVDAIYNRLDQCPVGTTPVYGRTPIFTCNNNGCGYGVA